MSQKIINATLLEKDAETDILRFEIDSIAVDVDGNVTSLEEIKALSTIPSREGLLTMLAGGLIGTVKDLSIALNLLSEQKSE